MKTCDCCLVLKTALVLHAKTGIENDWVLSPNVDCGGFVWYSLGESWAKVVLKLSGLSIPLGWPDRNKYLDVILWRTN